MKDKISSYAALVIDGHETYNNAMDALLTMISFLTDEDEIEDAHDHLDSEFEHLDGESSAL